MINFYVPKIVDKINFWKFFKETQFNYKHKFNISKADKEMQRTN